MPKYSQETIDNVSILGGMIQACMWQFETINHQFDKDAKRKMNMFKQYGYNMVDTINKSIENEPLAVEYFEEITVDAVDFFRTFHSSSNKVHLLEKMKLLIQEENLVE